MEGCQFFSENRHIPRRPDAGSFLSSFSASCFSFLSLVPLPSAPSHPPSVIPLASFSPLSLSSTLIADASPRSYLQIGVIRDTRLVSRHLSLIEVFHEVFLFMVLCVVLTCKQILPQENRIWQTHWKLCSPSALFLIPLSPLICWRHTCLLTSEESWNSTLRLSSRSNMKSRCTFIFHGQFFSYSFIRESSLLRETKKNLFLHLKMCIKTRPRLSQAPPLQWRCVAMYMFHVEDSIDWLGHCWKWFRTCFTSLVSSHPNRRISIDSKAIKFSKKPI